MPGDGNQNDNLTTKFLERIIDRLDHFESLHGKLSDKQVEMNEILLRNTYSLEEHIRGVRALEAQNATQETRIQVLETDKKAVTLAWTSIAKWGTLAAAIGASLMKIAEYVGNHITFK